MPTDKPTVALFQYSIILQPKIDKDGEVTEPAAIVVEPTFTLATDANQASIIAARAIPDDMVAKIDRLSIAVRPF